MRSARAAEPRDAPAAAAASPLRRPRARAALGPGAHGRAPRPRSHFSTPRGTRPRPASRACRLTCGSGRRAEAPSSLPRAEAASRPPAPAALRPPPPRSGTLAFLLRPPDAQPAARVRAPSCAQVEAARQAPRERPSQAPGPGPGPWYARAGADRPAPPPHPHLPPPGPPRPRLLPSSAPRPPTAPAAAAAAGRRGREEAPRSGSASPGAVPPTPGPGGTQVLPLQRSPLRCAGIRWGSRSHRGADGHCSLLRVGSSHRESELRKGEGAHLREPVWFSPLRSRIQI